MNVLEKVLSRIASLPVDKVLHFTIGAVLALLALPFGLKPSLCLVFVAGITKELYDGTLGRIYGHRADPWDIVATVLGGAVVWAAFLLGSLR